VNAANVRFLVGGLPLLVSLLDSDHADVQAYACSAIANVAKDGMCRIHSSRGFELVCSLDDQIKTWP
jgi:hypothetical protein